MGIVTIVVSQVISLVSVQPRRAKEVAAIVVVKVAILPENVPAVLVELPLVVILVITVENQDTSLVNVQASPVEAVVVAAISVENKVILRENVLTARGVGVAVVCVTVVVKVVTFPVSVQTSLAVVVVMVVIGVANKVILLENVLTVIKVRLPVGNYC